MTPAFYHIMKDALPLRPCTIIGFETDGYYLLKNNNSIEVLEVPAELVLMPDEVKDIGGKRKRHYVPKTLEANERN